MKRLKSKESAVEPLPFYAKVRVGAGRGVPANAVGKLGVVLGRAPLAVGHWTYSIFLEGLNESYSLPHAALWPTGEVLKRSDIYGGETVALQKCRTIDPTRREHHVGGSRVRCLKAHLRSTTSREMAMPRA
ncbi:MAG: immunity protein 31 [Phycisphaerae bacterium]|nr:immunity protein 31 [Phycisphaerae bacterium]